ncbi:hypothetical protein [Arhodomonas sp. AD133]|uniref:hypothetical protein n=1 Tax=Arhodomonas sp. AD133 TaxID=3415009 RepID=UPI003EBCFC2C
MTGWLFPLLGIVVLVALTAFLLGRESALRECKGQQGRRHFWFSMRFNEPFKTYYYSVTTEMDGPLTERSIDKLREEMQRKMQSTARPTILAVLELDE